MVAKIKELASSDNPVLQGIFWGLLCSVVLVSGLLINKDKFQTLKDRRKEAYFASVFASTVPVLIAGSDNIPTAAWRCMQKFSGRRSVSLVDTFSNDMLRAARAVAMHQACPGTEKITKRKAA